MSLVAYGSSGSESESEECETQNHSVPPRAGSPPPAQGQKRKQPVKIMAPSLEELPESDEDTTTNLFKKLKPNPERKTGLLSMLPPPRKFIKPKKTTDFVPPSVVASRKLAAPLAQDSDDEDDELAGPSKFFTLEEITPLVAPSSTATLLVPPPVTPEVVEVHTPPQNDEKNLVKQFVSDPDKMPDTCLPDNMDMEVLRKLQGKNNLGREDIQIIDVRADDQRSDADIWLTKQISVEKPEKKKSEDQPSSVHRRKHQITYLAFQAKERELELKNQWATNRMTRKQAQSKYGF